jgi:hypothetical protein
MKKTHVFFYLSILLLLSGISTAFGQITNKAVLDWTGDGRTDLYVVTHANDGTGLKTYFCRRAMTSQSSAIGFTDLGLTPSTEFVLGADFENDSDTEDVNIRPNSVFPNQFDWRARGSSPFNPFTLIHGNAADDPTIIGDYTGDGKADLAVFRCNPNDPVGTQCYWIFRQSEIGLLTWIPWGTVYAAGKADIAAPGDYDGDGKHDFAVRRLSNPNDPNSQTIFYVLRSSDFGIEYRAFGIGSDKFVKGDFDGDGKTDLCAVRNSQSQGTQMQWFIRYSSTGSISSSIPFGLGKSGVVGDYIAPGDYTGDGRTDVAVWRRKAINEKTYFYILSSTATQGAFGTVLFEPIDACAPAQCEYPVAQYLVH